MRGWLLVICLSIAICLSSEASIEVPKIWVYPYFPTWVPIDITTPLVQWEWQFQGESFAHCNLIYNVRYGAPPLPHDMPDASAWHVTHNASVSVSYTLSSPRIGTYWIGFQCQASNPLLAGFKMDHGDPYVTGALSSQQWPLHTPPISLQSRGSTPCDSATPIPFTRNTPHSFTSSFIAVDVEDADAVVLDVTMSDQTEFNQWYWIGSWQSIPTLDSYDVQSNITDIPTSFHIPQHMMREGMWYFVVVANSSGVHNTSSTTLCISMQMNQGLSTNAAELTLSSAPEFPTLFYSELQSFSPGVWNHSYTFTIPTSLSFVQFHPILLFHTVPGTNPSSAMVEHDIHAMSMHFHRPFNQSFEISTFSCPHMDMVNGHLHFASSDRMTFLEEGVWELSVSLNISTTLPVDAIQVQIFVHPCIDDCSHVGECRVHNGRGGGPPHTFQMSALIPNAIPHCSCGHRYAGSACQRETSSLAFYILETVALVGSNLWFLFPIWATWRRRLVLDMIVFVFAMCASSFYHACDIDAFCLFSLHFSALQYSDFVGSLVCAFMVVLYFANEAHKDVKRNHWAMMLLFLALVLVRDTLSNICFMALVMGMAIGFDLYTWRHYWIPWLLIHVAKRSKLSEPLLEEMLHASRDKEDADPSLPRQFHWKWFVFGAIFGIGAGICWFTETITNYWWVHSLWHVCITTCAGCLYESLTLID